MFLLIFLLCVGRIVLDQSHFVALLPESTFGLRRPDVVDPVSGGEEGRGRRLALSTSPVHRLVLLLGPRLSRDLSGQTTLRSRGLHEQTLLATVLVSSGVLSLHPNPTVSPHPSTVRDKTHKT